MTPFFAHVRRNRLRWLGFILVPLGINALLLGLYFTPWAPGQQLVAPSMPSLSSNSGREFGLLESLQNLYLLVIVGAALLFAWRWRNPWQCAFGLVVALGAGFVLLEEIDYGLHYYEYLSGRLLPHYTPRNLHNLGDNLRWFKLAMDGGMVLLFCLIPLATYRFRERSPLVGYLRTNCWYLAGVVLFLLLSRLAHLLDDIGLGNGNLHQNIGEFREHNVYYLAMLYFLDLFLRRPAPPAPAWLLPLRGIRRWLSTLARTNDASGTAAGARPSLMSEQVHRQAVRSEDEAG